MDANATNRWQKSHYPLIVRPIKDTGSECRDATRIFALFGDLRSSPRPAHRGGRRTAFLAVATVLLPAAADPTPAVGSVSSGSVEISVLVAPRYKVIAFKAPDAASVRSDVHPGWFCLTTNSSVPTMPVKLVWPRTRRPNFPEVEPGEDMQLANATATGISRCGLMEAKPASRTPDPEDRLAGQLWLIRPE